MPQRAVRSLSGRVGAEPRRERELDDLMVAYQGGDFAAFEELYRWLAPKLRGYLSSLTWRASATEDLLQEAFLQMHRSRRTYLPGRPVVPWAFAVARHVYLMHRRDLARRSKHEDTSADGVPDLPVPPAVESLGTREAVVLALRELAQDGREALLLHHVWGFSFGEIGALLGIREVTARVRTHRAVSALKELLAAENPRGRGHEER